MFTDVDIGKLPRSHRSAMYGKVLRSLNRHVVLGIATLHSGDVGNAHATGQERIFAVGLLTSAPARVTKDIQVRRPEIQAAANARVSLAHVLHMFNASLDTNLGRHGMNPRRVESRRQTDRLRILRYPLVDDSMKCLT